MCKEEVTSYQLKVVFSCDVPGSDCPMFWLAVNDRMKPSRPSPTPSRSVRSSPNHGSARGRFFRGSAATPRLKRLWHAGVSLVEEVDHEPFPVLVIRCPSAAHGGLRLRRMPSVRRVFGRRGAPFIVRSFPINLCR